MFSSVGFSVWTRPKTSGHRLGMKHLELLDDWTLQKEFCLCLSFVLQIGWSSGVRSQRHTAEPLDVTLERYLAMKTIPEMWAVNPTSTL